MKTPVLPPLSTSLIYAWKVMNEVSPVAEVFYSHDSGAGSDSLVRIEKSARQGRILEVTSVRKHSLLEVEG